MQEKLLYIDGNILKNRKYYSVGALSLRFLLKGLPFLLFLRWKFFFFPSSLFSCSFCSFAGWTGCDFTLESRVAELKATITEDKANADNAEKFLKLVRKHTDIKELTAEVLREFVEKVYVYQSERIDGKKVQRIKIIYNCIGDFQTPSTEHEKTA